MAAENLYNAILQFAEPIRDLIRRPLNPEKYNILGKSYAMLGLKNEAFQILDDSINAPGPMDRDLLNPLGLLRKISESGLVREKKYASK